MGTALVVVVLVVICAFAVYSFVKKLRKGGGCCPEREVSEKKVKVADKDKSHYPYQTTLTIDGMTCANCATRVENALNSLPGVWAKVDLMGKIASVLLKQPPEADTLRKTVQDVGYTVLRLT